MKKERRDTAIKCIHVGHVCIEKPIKSIVKGKKKKTQATSLIHYILLGRRIVSMEFRGVQLDRSTGIVGSSTAVGQRAHQQWQILLWWEIYYFA